MNTTKPKTKRTVCARENGTVFLSKWNNGL